MAGGLKRYFVMNGRMIGQQLSPGGSRVDFMTDALGSVTGTVGSNGAVQKTYRFTPYGQFLSETGTGPDPDFRWNGVSQYYNTGLQHADYYVRARNYSSTEGRWTTVDSTWPNDPAYRYLRANPVGVRGLGCSCSTSYPTYWSKIQVSASGSVQCSLQRCNYSFKGLSQVEFINSWTCTDCVYYQYVWEDGAGPYKDCCEGWPYQFPCDIQPYSRRITCSATDAPGWANLRCPCFDGTRRLEWLGCICCCGFSVCLRWSIAWTIASGCTVAKAVAVASPVQPPNTSLSKSVCGGSLESSPADPQCKGGCGGL